MRFWLSLAWKIAWKSKFWQDAIWCLRYIAHEDVAYWRLEFWVFKSLELKAESLSPEKFDVLTLRTLNLALKIKTENCLTELGFLYGLNIGKINAPLLLDMTSLYWYGFSIAQPRYRLLKTHPTLVSSSLIIIVVIVISTWFTRFAAIILRLLPSGSTPTNLARKETSKFLYPRNLRKIGISKNV